MLACGVVVLLGRQSVPPSSAPVREVVHEPDKIASARVEAAPSEAVSSPPTTNGATFRGRVIDAVTRQPVREFEVQLIRVHRGPNSYRSEETLTRTFQSSTGRFARKDLQAGTWIAMISAHDYQRFDLAEFSIPAGKTLPELTMPLVRGFTVRGRIFDLNTGAGIADAYVMFVPPDVAYHGDGMHPPSARSKEDGTFELDGVPGGDATLNVSAKSHARASVEVRVNDEMQPVEIGLSTGGAISGGVVTAAGAPIKALLSLDGPDGALYATDDDGVFSFEGLPAGSFTLSGSTSAGAVKQDFELAPGERRSGMILRVVAGRAIRGTVRGLRPEQMKKTFVSAQSQRQGFQSQVDEQGTYALNGLPPGRANVEVYVPGRRMQKTVDVPADKDVVFDFVFPTGARLSGHVTRGGKPFANERVWMRPAGPKVDSGYSATTSADGQYEIEGLPSGEYRLQADNDIVRSIAIAGDTVLNIEIPSVQVGGHVLEDEGAVPVVAADVYVRGIEAATSQVRADAESDHFGGFKITGVAPGDVELIVYKPGYELYREKVAYSTPITDKTIRLRKGGGVEVRVQRSATEPVRGFYVSDKNPENDWRIDYWIPLDRDGVGVIPSALTGRTLLLDAYVGKPIMIRDWDGSPLELKF